MHSLDVSHLGKSRKSYNALREFQVSPDATDDHPREPKWIEYRGLRRRHERRIPPVPPPSDNTGG
jgi:hypothetical protein